LLAASEKRTMGVGGERKKSVVILWSTWQTMQSKGEMTHTRTLNCSYWTDAKGLLVNLSQQACMELEAMCRFGRCLAH